MLNNVRKISQLMTPEAGLPVKAGEVIFAGALVALQGGLAVRGKTATDLRSYGCALETVDNSDGGDGALKVKVRKDIFLYRNQGDDPVTAEEIEKDCYIVDDETVAKTDDGGTRSVAGKVFNVEANGVWVDFR